MEEIIHFNYINKDFIDQLPPEVKFNEIAQSFDLDEVTVSIDSAIAALTIYVQENYTGHFPTKDIPKWTDLKIDFEVDGETGSFLAQKVALLVFARDVLERIRPDVAEHLYYWWKWRYAQLAQDLIGQSDKSPTLFNIFLEASHHLEHSNFTQQNSTKQLFLCEYIQSALMYYKYDEAIDKVKQLEESHGIRYELSGALGRRTKHQTYSIPQLYIKVNQKEVKNISSCELDRLYEERIDIVNHVLEDEHSGTLEQVKFDDENIQATADGITTLGSTIGLVKMTVLMKTGPTKDRINEEEQLTYINFIISNNKAAPVVVAEALRLRSLLEVHKFAQAHRGMKQLQAIMSLVTEQNERAFSLQHFYASKLPPIWDLRRMLCKTFIKMGCIKAALEEYMGNYSGSA